MGDSIRVLHIASERGWRGGENQIRLLLSGLRNSEIENHVFAEKGSSAAERLQDHAIVTPIRMRGLRMVKAAMAVVSYCRKHNIDIIDAHSSRAHSIGLLAKKFGARAKLVVHRRVDYLPGQHAFGLWKYKSADVAKYVAISGAIAAILRKAGLDEHRIRVVPSAVDPAPFISLDRKLCHEELRRAFSLQETTFFCGNASALTEQKGHETLLEAIARLRANGKDIHAFIAGDGHLRRSLEALRIELGLDHDVTFLGFIEDVPTFLGAIDLLVVPSNYEGLGTIIQNGIHAGCPVVASDVGGIPEMIKDGITGLLVPPGNAENLAACIERVMDDHALKARLVTNAKDHLEKHFSLKSMVEGNRAVYQELARGQ